MNFQLYISKVVRSHWGHRNHVYIRQLQRPPLPSTLHHAGCDSLNVHYTFRPYVSTHTHTAQIQWCVYQTGSQPCDHTWPCRELPSYPDANNTSHVQDSINRSFDGSCWEFQGGGVHAGIPGVPTGGSGGVWSSFGTRGEKWRS